MKMTSKQINGINILQLSGRFDAYAAPALEESLQKLNAGCSPYIIIDLSQVDFIDSTGLAALVIGMKHCRQQKGDLTLCSIGQPIHTIFTLTRLDKVFTIADTQEEALAKMPLQQEG